MSHFAITQAVFGKPLETVMSYQHEQYPQLSVPVILLLLRDTLLNMHAETTEGIFRIPGTQDEIDCYKQLFDDGKYAVWPECNVHTLAGLFKLFLRELPDPVVPVGLYDTFVCQETIDGLEESPAKAQELLGLLPSPNREVFIFIIDFLQLVGSHAEETMMSVPNLAMVFSACLLINPDLDPLSALTKTETAKRCIAGFIRQMGKDEMEAVHLEFEGYAEGDGMDELADDPTPLFRESKESKSKRKTFLSSITLNASSRRRSSHSSMSSNSSLQTAPGSSSLQLPPHKRQMSSSVDNKLVQRTPAEPEKKRGLWDVDVAPPALARPNFNVMRLTTPR